MNAIEVEFLRNHIQSIEINISATKRNLDDMIDGMRKMEKELSEKKQILLQHELIENGKKVCQLLQCKTCSVCQDSLIETIVGRSVIHYNCSCNNGNIVHMKCFIPLLKDDGNRYCPLCRECVKLSSEDTDLYTIIDGLSNNRQSRPTMDTTPRIIPVNPITPPNIIVIDTARTTLPSLPNLSSRDSSLDEEDDGYNIRDVM